MNDRLVEITQSCHVGVDVERVYVSVEPVKESLVWLRFFLSYEVRGPLGDLGELDAYRLFMAKAAKSSDVYGC